MAFVKLEQYTCKEMFQKIIDPLSQKFPEIHWFIDNNVSRTYEPAGTIYQEGWTDYFLSDSNSENPAKFIELERTLSSVVFFHLIYDGSQDAYQQFVKAQFADEKLTFDSYQRLHQFARKIAPDINTFDNLVAALVYSDLGKTPEARRRGNNMGITCPDHDDWIEAILELENNQLNEIFPSFQHLAADTQLFLKQVVSSLKINLGHVHQCETGTKAFQKLLPLVRNGQLSKELVNQAFMVQLCDVAAASAHGQCDSSSVYTEKTHFAYKVVKKQLKKFLETCDPAQAIQEGLKLRAEKLDIPTESAVTVRLACLMRLYYPDEGAVLLQQIEELDKDDWELICEQFGLESGFNTWHRNPTYMPGVLVNLAKFNNREEPLAIKLGYALKGAICMARIFERYEEELKHRDSDVPLCMNNLAGEAAKSRESFTTPSEFSFCLDARNNVILEKPPSFIHTEGPRC